MQTTFKTNAFRMFDKVILILMAAWLLIAIGRASLRAPSPEDQKASEIPGLIQKIEQRQKAATHKPAVVDRDALTAWLAKGLAYAASLPPKEKKPRKKKA